MENRWWNLGGLNPNLKEFLDKHQDKTLIGVLWSMQWRFIVVLLAFEIVILVLLFILAFFGVFGESADIAK